MTFYDKLMHPLESFYLESIRRELIPQATGQILEVGVGSGANNVFYKDERITTLDGLDVVFSADTRRQLTPTMTLTIGHCENLPYPDNYFDTVVTTLVLCSVTDLSLSLSEIKRVLKDSGRYLFIEHLLPERQSLKTLFKAANPLWCLATHGCHLTRRSDLAIQDTGFTFTDFHKNPSGILCYGRAQKKETI